MMQAWESIEVVFVFIKMGIILLDIKWKMILGHILIEITAIIMKEIGLIVNLMDWESRLLK